MAVEFSIRSLEIPPYSSNRAAVVFDQTAVAIKSPSFNGNISFKANSMAGKAHNIHSLISRNGLVVGKGVSVVDRL